jgi:hypothetical protein
MPENNFLLKEYIKNILRTELLKEIHYSDVYNTKGWQQFFDKYGTAEKVKKLGYNIKDLYVNLNNHASDKIDKRIRYDKEDDYTNDSHSDPAGVYGYPLSYIIEYPMSLRYGTNFKYLRVLLHQKTDKDKYVDKNKHPFDYQSMYQRGKKSKGSFGSLSVDDINNNSGEKQNELQKGMLILSNVRSPEDIRAILSAGNNSSDSYLSALAKMFDGKSDKEINTFCNNVNDHLMKGWLKPEKYQVKSLYGRILFYILQKNIIGLFDDLSNQIGVDLGQEIGNKDKGIDGEEVARAFFGQSVKIKNLNNHKYAIRLVEQDKFVKTQSSQNKIFRAIGINAIKDDPKSSAYASVHPNEPEQIIFLNRGAFQVLDVFELMQEKNIESEKIYSALIKIINYVFGENNLQRPIKNTFHKVHAGSNRSRYAISTNKKVYFDIKIEGDRTIDDIEAHKKDHKKYSTYTNYENHTLLIVYEGDRKSHENRVMLEYKLRPNESIEEALPKIKELYWNSKIPILLGESPPQSPPNAP